MSKNKKGKVIKFQPIPIKKYIKEHARKLPIVACYKFGDNGTGIFNVCVVRAKRNGNIIVGSYLVDTYCLGVKNTYASEFDEITEFINTMESGRYGSTKLELIETNYAQNLIYGAIEFAEDAGFEPHKDFSLTEYILDDVETLEFIDIEFGQNGKYVYWEGPDDNTKKIIATLDENIGKGNYHFVAGFGDEDDDDDEVYDDEDDEDNGEYPEKYLELVADLDQLEQTEREEIFISNMRYVPQNAKTMYGASHICALGIYDLWKNTPDLQNLYKNDPKLVITKSEQYFEDKFQKSKSLMIPKDIIIYCVENMIHFNSPNFVLLDDFVEAVSVLVEKGAKDGYVQEVYDFLLSFHYKRNNSLILLMNKIAQNFFGVVNFRDLEDPKLNIAIEKLIELICTLEVENDWLEFVDELDFLEYLENFLPNESNDEIRTRIRNLKNDIFE